MAGDGDESCNLVLLVEDHADVREALGLYLEADGYAVEQAADGREALTKLFAGLRPCLIILDLTLPVMNGFEFREEQLKYPDLADIPILAYSAVIDVDAHAKHLRAAAYLQKPADPSQVLSIVRALCVLPRG